MYPTRHVCKLSNKLHVNFPNYCKIANTWESVWQIFDLSVVLASLNYFFQFVKSFIFLTLDYTFFTIIIITITPNSRSSNWIMSCLLSLEHKLKHHHLCISYLAQQTTLTTLTWVQILAWWLSTHLQMSLILCQNRYQQRTLTSLISILEPFQEMTEIT